MFGPIIASLGLLGGWAGLALLAWRLKPWQRWGAPPEQSGASVDAALSLDAVSVIVPLRNEAANLAACVAGLLAAGAGEIVLVDDQSDDATPQLLAGLAREHPVRIKVLSAPPRPAGWIGKNWACMLGAELARGDYLLFTDADTRHLPGSLAAALEELQTRRFDLLSALPYHLNASWWEGLMGPLQLMALAVTAPFDRARPRRLFAIGQYLLFRRKAYLEIGGHRAVGGELAEDLHFARRCLTQGLSYGVSRRRYYGVRMYARLGDFLAGWRRLSALGLQFAGPLAGPEVLLYYLAFSGGGLPGSRPASLLLMLLTLGLSLGLQPRLGRFSPLGPLIFPFALGCFALATLLGLIDSHWNRGLSWRGRRYALRPEARS